MESTPYQAPASNLDTTIEGHNEEGLFSFSGRIGRLRYLAYGGVMSLIMYAVIGLAFVILGLGSSGGEPSGAVTAVSFLIGGVAYIAMIVFSFAYAVRRLNDMDMSGWLSLLMIVPVANIVIILMILFKAGSTGSNQYGLPPRPNTTLIYIGGLIMPFIAIIGILAAIALPAYQDYVVKAQEAEALYNNQ